MLRRRLTIAGTVQGVGFRPFVCRLAREEGLTGLVRNAARGVVLEVQGGDAQFDRFLRRMAEELPTSARLEECSLQPLPVVPGEETFSITTSSTAGSRAIGLAADSTVCPDCLREMWDRSDRRYRYPFITCASCGPRYTISLDLPFDRSRTTMAPFGICPDCRREYASPSNRRFHAQTIACPACGPRAWLVRAERDPTPPTQEIGDHPALAVFAASDLLARGGIVALKGIGGFLLAADAENREAVEGLRRSKRRQRKPLAVMVRDLEVAQALVVLDSESEELLCSRAAPIVLAPSRNQRSLAAGVAPGLGDLGIMLPSSPLHHLLFRDRLDALVMTSGNRPSEPMITENRTALEELDADAFLLHDREVHLATDDSVIRTGPSGPLFIRRARGFVPDALDASFLPPASVLALGAELKVSVTTLKAGQLVVGRHLGDLHGATTERAFRGEVDRMLRFGGVEPEMVAVDLHPDLASTLLGEQMEDGARLVRVQHHHAHFCAVLVEHRFPVETAATGIILDGLGYGSDGTLWGGEVIRGGYDSFRRVGHLRRVPQPGGDKAALEPRRMATSLLRDAGLGHGGMSAYDEEIARICAVAEVSPLTSSAGRLFDGVAAILGVAPPVQSYEGEAAAVLEAVADPSRGDAYPLPLEGEELDTRALIAALVEDQSPIPTRAARFHNGLADGFVRLARSAESETAILGGGCMVNRILFRRLECQLRSLGIAVKWPAVLPAGDGGLSAGQAAAAACATAVGGE